jgi:hypothetical protein
MNYETILGRLKTLIEVLTNQTRYCAIYSARVVKQDPITGALEVVFETERMPSLQGVPIRAGLPGVAIEVDPGARVNIAFENADPSRPIATVWDAKTARLSFNSPLRPLLQPIARKGDPAKTDYLCGTAGPYPVTFFTVPDPESAGELPVDEDGNIIPPTGASTALQLVATIADGAPDLKA